MTSMAIADKLLNILVYSKLVVSLFDQLLGLAFT